MARLIHDHIDAVSWGEDICWLDSLECEDLHDEACRRFDAATDPLEDASYLRAALVEVSR